MQVLQKGPGLYIMNETGGKTRGAAAVPVKEEFFMSNDVNLYQSPQSPANPAAGMGGPLTGTMLRHLRDASPWLRFIGVIGFISCGLMAMGGIASFISSFFMGNLWSEVAGVAEYADIFGIFFGVFMGLYFIIFAVLSFFPSLFVYNFGARIRSYLQSGMERDLETAFKNNKSFWKFTGILVIISLAFIPALLVLGVIIVIAAA
jgi:hypothetical protein